MAAYLHKFGRIIFVSVVLPLAVSAGCARNPVTGKLEPSLISHEQEIAIGRETAPQFEKKFGGRVPNDRLQEYVRSVGMRMAAVSHRQMPYDYTLLASDVPNAFALPGGKIFITAGLMSRITNERQLAAVLGHETGHVAAKHNVNAMQRQMGAALLVEMATRIVAPENAATAADVTKIVTTIGNLRYGRGDEYQADELGIEYMTKAGYNPWGMVELLTVLKNLSESEPGSFGEMFQTHPLSSKRIGQATAIIRGGDDYRKFSQSTPDPRERQFLKMRSLLRTRAPEHGERI